MTEATKEMEQWIKKELNFVIENMSTTFNAKMHPEYVSCNAEEKELVLKFEIYDWELNGLGTGHGGIISSMMDFSMSNLLYYFAQGGIPATISQTTNYIRPVPAKCGVLIQIKLTSNGRKIGSCYCEAIIPDSKKVAATSTATYALTPVQQ